MAPYTTTAASVALALVAATAHRALRLCALGGTRMSGSAAVAVLVVLVSGIASCVVDVVLLQELFYASTRDAMAAALGLRVPRQPTMVS